MGIVEKFIADIQALNYDEYEKLFLPYYNERLGNDFIWNEANLMACVDSLGTSRESRGFIIIKKLRENEKKEKLDEIKKTDKYKAALEKLDQQFIDNNE